MSQRTCAEQDDKTKCREKNDVDVSGVPALTEDSSYPGSGTREDPYVVDWNITDTSYPYNWSNTKRWIITLQVRQTKRLQRRLTRTQ